MMSKSQPILFFALMVVCVVAASIADGALVTSGPHGPGGTYNVYALNTTSQTWDQSRVAAAAISINGVGGHLATIKDAAENATIDSIAGDAWIGFTDSDQTSTIDGATMPGSEGNFVWITGEPVTFVNWGGGEPNNSGGEDATQIRGDGAWNDHHAGSTLGQSNHNLQSVIEFDLNLGNDPAAGGVPVFNYREVASNIGTIDNLAEGETILASGGAQEKSALVTVVNLKGGGGQGRFGNNDGFLIGGNNYASEFTTNVLIPEAGEWTFGTNSDDGTGLWVGPFSKIDDVTSGPHDNLQTFNFTTAGWHPLRLVFFEKGGGEEVELFAAEGAQGGFNSNFALVGDTANGGLRIQNGIVPEPASLVMWSLLAALALGLARRRK